MRPVLFYTIGYPGVGKTTLAANLSSWLGSVHLRGDKIGLQLFVLPTYSAHERHMVYTEMNRLAAQQLDLGAHVLYDAATNTHAQRTQLIELARARGSEAIGLWVQTPIALAKERAGNPRDKGIVGQVVRVIPPHVFDQYVAAFEPPTQQEHVIIPGNTSFQQQYLRLQRQLPDRRLPRFI